MIGIFRKIFDDGSEHLRGRIVSLYWPSRQGRSYLRAYVSRVGTRRWFSSIDAARAYL